MSSREAGAKLIKVLVCLILALPLSVARAAGGSIDLSESRWLFDVSEGATGHIIFKADSSCAKYVSEVGSVRPGRYTVSGDSVTITWLHDVRGWSDSFTLVHRNGRLRFYNSIEGAYYFYYRDECDSRDVSEPDIVFDLPIQFEAPDDLKIWPPGSEVPSSVTRPWSFCLSESDTVLVSSPYIESAVTVRNGRVVGETQLPEETTSRRLGHGAEHFFLQKRYTRDTIFQYDKSGRELQSFPAELVGDYVADSTGLWITMAVVGIDRVRYYAFRYDFTTGTKDSCRLDMSQLPTIGLTTSCMISAGNSLYIPTRDSLLEIGPNCATARKHPFPQLRPWHRILDVGDNRFIAISDYLEVLVHNRAAGESIVADLKCGLQKLFAGWPGHDYMVGVQGNAYHFDAQVTGDELLVMGVKQDTTYILSFPIDSF